jgi:hypothetical protein
MTEPVGYPGHTCTCADDDLSQVWSAIPVDAGRAMLVRCGWCDWRRIPRERWDAELRRRQQQQERAQP